MKNPNLQSATASFTESFTKALDTFSKSMEGEIIDTRPMLFAIDENNEQLSADYYRMDLAMLKAAPVAVVPRFSLFYPLEENGHRFLLADDGMYLEVRRPWLYLVHRLAEQTAVAMPFGHIEPETTLAFGRLSNALNVICAFAESAKREAPNEWADQIVWNEKEQKLSDLNVSILAATAGSVKYECRPLEDYESVAIDLHSHGHLPAFFSITDNEDDAGSVKIAGVLGDLDKEHPTAMFRLCVLGLYLPIVVPAERIFGGA